MNRIRQMTVLLLCYRLTASRAHGAECRFTKTELLLTCAAVS